MGGHSRTGTLVQIAYPRRVRAQRGVFAVMTPALLIVALGLVGMALDFGQIYNRRAELQGVAQSIALAAAPELNGTSAGITAALTQAALAAQRARYGFAGTRTVSWNDDALQFSASPAPGTTWVSADIARAQPADKFFVKVDTSMLAQDLGRVDTPFMQLFSSTLGTAWVSDRAVAGRASIDVMPMAICAMSTEAGAKRINPGPPVTEELVEYGFRRGIGYDLMQLNPHGTTPINYMIDPQAPPGGLGNASHMSASAIAPFVCTGQMWIARLTGGNIRVTSPFPLGSLYRELNSRFDQYDGSRCHLHGAPPDTNIKAYTPGSTSTATWMSPRPNVQAAMPTTEGGVLRTIADLPAASATTPGDYGPIWSAAKAVKFSSYTPGAPEPANGYATFTPTEWKSLYPASTQITPNSYPSLYPPYSSALSAHTQKPSVSHQTYARAKRRMLHIPLLACPVPPGSNVGASAVAIARFVMTVPATDTSLHAEFAGLLAHQHVTGRVTLYP